MKKSLFGFLIATLAIFVSDGTARADFLENPLPVQRFEGGLKVGFGIPLCDMYGNKAVFGYGEIMLEGRYNIPDTPWDTGICFGGITHPWREKDGTLDRLTHSYFAVLGDYNFRQGRKVNPYAGTSFGFDANNRKIVVGPRIGVELVYHIRIETVLYLGERVENMFMVSAGFSIGGRPKRSRVLIAPDNW